MFQIARRCLTDGDASLRPAIASVFARPGIPGFIFVEGRPCDVTAAVRDLVTVFRGRWLVPPEERATLLSRRNPLSRDVSEGEWVRCRHGLYRGDIGLVCGHDPSSEAHVIVALIPRIPDGPPSSVPKRKRSARPEPRKWSADRAKAVWGEKVRKISDEVYELKHDTYKSGLVIKHLAPASVAISDAPLDIDPFLSAPYVSNFHFYSLLAFRYAQDTIKVGQRVKVLDGEQQGLVGHPTDITDGVATVVTDDDTPPLIISLRALAAMYLPGDHIKHRHQDSRGIVVSVNEDRTVTFVDKEANEEVRTSLSVRYTNNTPLQYTAHMDAVEPYTPPANLYRFTPGLWVHFVGPSDSERPKRRGYITAVEDVHAVVIDERTFTEVSDHLYSAGSAYTLDAVQDPQGRS